MRGASRRPAPIRERLVDRPSILRKRNHASRRLAGRAVPVLLSFRSPIVYRSRDEAPREGIRPIPQGHLGLPLQPWAFAECPRVARAGVWLKELEPSIL